MGRPKKVEFTVVKHGKCSTCKNESDLMQILQASDPSDLNERVLVFAGQPLTIERRVSFTLNGHEKRPGRPAGSKNKAANGVTAAAPTARRKAGRPPGSKNKVGRPAGSKNKAAKASIPAVTAAPAAAKKKFKLTTVVVKKAKKRGPGRPRKVEATANGTVANPT